MPQAWVFGYGSLMWNPGFAFVEHSPALIHGYHRSLCVYSHVYRGTPERPGLVMGLDRGGSCHGMAFRIAERRWPQTLAYLRRREQVTLVYREVKRPVRLIGERRERVEAVVYVADRAHRQYAGKLDVAAQRALIAQGCGRSGRCRDYVLATLDHLRGMAIHDATLEALADGLEPQP